MIAFRMATAILESNSSDVPGIASATWRGASGARKLAEFWMALYIPALAQGSVLSDLAGSPLTRFLGPCVTSRQRDGGSTTRCLP
jgi:hypothetical protein